jgi:glucose-6-phosphate 1-dehydrogenase
MNGQQPKSLIVIFGATGDLANRKLYPSIYNLFRKGNLSDNFAVVGVSRRPLTSEAYRQKVHKSITKSEEHTDNDKTESFLQHFYYQSVDATNLDSFLNLRMIVNDLDSQYQTNGNRIFYLAMAPQFFGQIAFNLRESGLADVSGWKRLVIEKPFGHNFESAQKLNNQLRSVFSEDEIYRIDHYLGKEMVQNIEVIRFANAFFEPLWNNRYISNIQITSSETIGIGDRARYYESSGALRDMVQNHMLQMISLLAMEPPSKLSPEEIRGEKVKVLRSLRTIEGEDVAKYFVRGQYDAGVVGDETAKAYRDEENVNPDSITETFVSAKLMIDNFRWSGVPFYIRTGKRMATKSTQIVVEFKDIPMDLYFNKGGKRGPNLLVIHIQPDEGITLHLNTKTPGSTGGTMPVAMEFCRNCETSLNSPEAYERLIFDCMRGESTNFAHWDEVALSWKFIDPISQWWSTKKELNLPNYPSGTMGPVNSDELLGDEGSNWWPITSVEK